MNTFGGSIFSLYRKVLFEKLLVPKLQFGNQEFAEGVFLLHQAV